MAGCAQATLAAAQRPGELDVVAAASPPQDHLLHLDHVLRVGADRHGLPGGLGTEIGGAVGVFPGRRAVLHLLAARAEAIPLGAAQQPLLNAQNPQGGEVALERAAERGLVLPGNVVPGNLLQVPPQFADLDPPSRVRVHGHG